MSITKKVCGLAFLIFSDLVLSSCLEMEALEAVTRLFTASTSENEPIGIENELRDADGDVVPNSVPQLLKNCFYRFVLIQPGTQKPLDQSFPYVQNLIPLNSQRIHVGKIGNSPLLKQSV